MINRTFSLLNVDHVNLDKRWNYKSVISPYYRLYYIDNGHGILSSPNQELELTPGNLYLIPSFTLCSFKCTGFLSQYYIQFFENLVNGISLFEQHRCMLKLQATTLDITLIKKLLKINPGRGINRSDNPEVYEKEIYYKEYRELNQKLSNAEQMENQGILLILISRFLENLKYRSKESQEISSMVLKVINHIQLNLKQKLTIQDLAGLVNFSPDYFSRQFLKHTGQRPLAYIHQKRIEHSQYLIITTNKTLLDIALETGFNNLPHFSKIFKKHVQITPGAYRKQNLQIT